MIRPSCELPRGFAACKAAPAVRVRQGFDVPDPLPLSAGSCRPPRQSFGARDPALPGRSGELPLDAGDLLRNSENEAGGCWMLDDPGLLQEPHDPSGCSVRHMLGHRCFTGGDRLAFCEKIKDSSNGCNVSDGLVYWGGYGITSTDLIFSIVHPSGPAR